MEEKDRLNAERIAAMSGEEMKSKMKRLLPLLAGGDGKKLMALLYLSGSDPQKLRAALEKAAAGDGRDMSEIMQRLAAQPEGEAILARLFAALKG